MKLVFCGTPEFGVPTLEFGQGQLLRVANRPSADTILLKDLPASRQQELGEVGADEAGAAGDESLAGGRLRIGDRGRLPGRSAKAVLSKSRMLCSACAQ